MRTLNKIITAAAVLAVPGLTLPASGQILFQDDFDTDTSAQWVVNASSADTAAIFHYDYSADGIPSAPHSIGGTTFGLKFTANMSQGSAAGISASPLGQNFTGDYILRFDMWINVNGPFPGGGGGSTEFLTAGVGTTGDHVQWAGSGNMSDGGWFAVTGDGGSSRDFRAYKGSSEQFAESGQFAAGTSSAGGGAHNASDPYYHTVFPGGQEAPPAQQAAYPQQTGGLQPGAVGLAWREVVITKIDGMVNWKIDGLDIATLDTALADFSTEGNIFVGYMDLFSSVSDNPALSFGLVDNVVVEVVPEPATLGLGALGLGLLLLRRLRR